MIVTRRIILAILKGGNIQGFVKFASLDLGKYCNDGTTAKISLNSVPKCLGECKTSIILMNRIQYIKYCLEFGTRHASGQHHLELYNLLLISFHICHAPDTKRIPLIDAQPVCLLFSRCCYLLNIELKASHLRHFPFHRITVGHAALSKLLSCHETLESVGCFRSRCQAFTYNHFFDSDTALRNKTQDIAEHLSCRFVLHIQHVSTFRLVRVEHGHVQHSNRRTVFHADSAAIVAVLRAHLSSRQQRFCSMNS